MGRPHLIALLALDDVIAFDLGTPTQIFHAARDQRDDRLYQVKICTPGGQPVRSSAGFTVVPEHGLELLARRTPSSWPGCTTARR
jgi:transcriptional regulator GlxA family with amidase domain